jgi:lipopolysaccharide export system protein LptA
MMITRFGLTNLLIAAAMIAAGEAVARDSAQVPNAVQGFSQNRDQPIRIEAESLEMIDKKKQATFSGAVKVVQGDTTMTSKILVVFYDNAGSAVPKGSAKPPLKSETPGPGGSSSIRRLEAKGDVVVTQKDQVASGQKAVFDTTTNLITMSGSVVLTQCTNVMRGDRLVVDMTTGVSHLEADSGHVEGLFGQGCGAPATGPRASGATPGSKPN